MDDKKYQIFISSTYTDLKEARSKISETILNLYHFPVGMEMFSAGDSDQWAIISETISVSDYYVLIIGHRYGSVTKEGISYTEKEYDFAVEQKIPVLSFIRDRDLPTTAMERDDDPQLSTSLDRFITKAKTGRMCEFWKTTDDLATKIAVALPKTFARIPRVGWSRGREVDLRTALDELSVLSSENRLLREKLSNLERVELKSPDIKISINDENEVNLKIFDEAELPEIIIPKPIEPGDIPEHLRDFLDESAVESYNSSIPDNETIAKHKIDLVEFKNTTERSLTIEFKIFNTGTQKAKDINIFINAPDLVNILSTDDYDEPERPRLAIHYDPVKEAQKKYNEAEAAKNSGSKYTGRISDLLNLPAFQSHTGRTTEFRPSTFKAYRAFDEKRFGTVLNTGQIKLHLNELVHTLNTTIQDKFIIIPLKRGEGVIEVDIICEEYTDSRRLLIPLTVS
ncbi:DUF4062 domain-containing protein [Pseudomonas viridiflava]|uniref:DUF4062 domain-containing protein n=1 Tax=Pseudomonas viridiflava TaxID=33069 RepID=UPI001F625803|nr:DUF4062 domain-containing protein [Pseudomonas viridiflava]MCI3908841.1 DUF4062 domain-containing protein [Pseudomonas viridiflava]